MCGYPLKFEKQAVSTHKTGLSIEKNLLKHTAITKQAKASFMVDCPRVWNNAPKEVREANSLYSAKLAIKKHVKTLPA